MKEFDIPVNVGQLQEKLREQFLKNKHVTDIRIIDLLVIKVLNYVAQTYCRVT